MNNLVSALVSFLTLSTVVYASEPEKTRSIRFTVVGQLDNPVATVVKASDLVLPYLAKLSYTHFAEKKWFYLIRIKNERAEGSDRVKFDSQEIRKVYYNEKDNFADLGFANGDVVYIPSRW